MINAVTYLNFPNALEALTFYKEKFGASIINQTMGDDEMFKDLPPEYKMPEEIAKQFVMNAEFELLGQRFMVSDTMGQRSVTHEGISICFTFDGSSDEETKEVTSFFERAIEAGSEITMPLGATEWTKLYGMFKDPFGITWMVNAC